MNDNRRICVTKWFLLFVSFFTLTAQAAYKCEGIKDTPLEAFTIYELTSSNLDTQLDGGMDTVEELGNGILEYIYNNGCDNDITFRINKLITQYQPQTFNMKVDYYTVEDILTNVDVVCKKID